MVTHKQEYEEANRRAADRLLATPIARSAHYDRRTDRIMIDLSNNLSIGFSPRHAQGLERAKPEHLAKIEISPSGLGLHFPKLDADLYLPAILEGLLGSRQWMAQQLGKRGGQRRSKLKTAASRANGKLGGRPKKIRPAAHNTIHTKR